MTEIKEFHNFYETDLHQQLFMEYIADTIFYLIANLIEEVLENDQKTGLLISTDINGRKIKLLVERIRNEFEHTERFDKIIIEES